MNKKDAQEELMTSLKIMIENIESLPVEIMSHAVSHYDLVSFMILVYNLHRVNELPDEYDAQD